MMIKKIQDKGDRIVEWFIEDEKNPRFASFVVAVVAFHFAAFSLAWQIFP